MLKKRKKDFKTFVEEANSIILCMDTTGKITFFNRFAERFFGYKAKEIIGKNIVGTILPEKETTGRDLVRMINNICRDPERYKINENENIKKDGTRVWILWTNKPIINKKGEIAEILCIGNDETEIKKIEKEIHNSYNKLVMRVQKKTREFLETKKDMLFEIVDRKLTVRELYESEEKYRNIVECAVEGIFQSTEDGRLITANKAFADMLGYSSTNELISSINNSGRQIFADPEDRIVFENLLTTEGYLKGFETRFIRKDGSIIWVNINVRTVIDSFGRVLCLEGTIEDTTERKEKEQQLKKSYERLQKAMDGTINTLSTTVELRDPYTAGHQHRVTRLAVAIAKKLNYPEDHIKMLKVASILHDIGKLCVPAEILSKPGKISKNEFSVLRDHPDQGYEILKGIEFDYPVAEIIRQHHERMDGSGYPRGLKGDEILMDARIIGVADVVESMASHRPYRPSLGLEVALKEIKKNRGILYDSNVVDACARAIKEKDFSFE